MPLNSNVKTCTKCLEEKSYDEFGKYAKGRDGKQPRCRSCTNKYNSEWREANPEKAREIDHRSRNNQREYQRTWHSRRRLAQYNLTPEDFDNMLAAQGYKCANIGCDRMHSTDKPLHVDHDNLCCPSRVSCGKCVRGLLCDRCNRGILGFAKDDVAVLLGLVDYLDAHRNASGQRLKIDTTGLLLPQQI